MFVNCDVSTDETFEVEPSFLANSLTSDSLSYEDTSRYVFKKGKLYKLKYSEKEIMMKIETKELVDKTMNRKRFNTPYAVVADSWGRVCNTLNCINSTEEGFNVNNSIYSPEDYKIPDALKVFIEPYRVGFGNTREYNNFLVPGSREFNVTWKDDNTGKEFDYSGYRCQNPIEFSEDIDVIVRLLNAEPEKVSRSNINRDGIIITPNNETDFAIVMSTSDAEDVYALANVEKFPLVLTVPVRAKERYYRAVCAEDYSAWIRDVLEEIKNIK